MATRLVELPQVKRWINIASEDDDDLLEVLCDSASGFIQSWLNRDFGEKEYSELRSGNFAPGIIFANTPVVSVTELKVNDRVIPEAINSQSPGYKFTTSKLVLMLGARFPEGTLNVELKYTSGFAVIPNEVAQATTELVGKKYRERERIGQKTKVLAGEVVVFEASDLSDELKSVLRSYQKVAPV
jgi:hypothetical protein